jgi:MoxR-like ATPase
MSKENLSALEAMERLKEAVQQMIIGQEHLIDRLIIGLLTNGNLLLEGLPGLAKTRAVKSLARTLEAGLSRIQFTPDLLPSDVTGTEILHSEGGKDVLQFQPGPIFSNLILADEINRAPAKVQAALLEAMEERQVTVAGKTHRLPDLFMVLATQNPIEQEGTYPLPEAQMDRFLMHVTIAYPSDQEEAEIMRLVRGEQAQAKTGGDGEREPVAQHYVFDARRQIDVVHVSDAIENYIVQIVGATRHPGQYGDHLAGWIEVGASPRGTIALDKCARAHAWLQNRNHVTPDDVRAVAHDVLRHRLILTYEANAEGVTSDQVISAIIKEVAVV